MLAVTSDTEPVTNSTYNTYYHAYRNDANYWVNVTQMGSVSVSNGLALWNATGTNAGASAPGVISETHSYGMILAALYNDKPTFDRLSATVQAGIQYGNSQNGSTGLFPWRWVLTAGTSVSPNTSTIYSCSDSNSASDADINLGLAYLYADKAADVYGWSVTPSQGGSSYQTMATNYIQAIRQHDFSQTDTTLANRYVLAEGAAQATSGFGSNVFHYDYSDLRAYQLFEAYDPFPSANPQSTGESFWATAVTTTSTVWKALFDFGDTDPRVTENANTGLINAATNYVKLSNPTYGTLQAAFSDYTQVQANRYWTAYDSDAQRFPLRLLNYLDAKAAQGQTDSAMYGVAASNLNALGTSYVNASNHLASSVPIADPWSQSSSTIQDFTAAGLLAWAGNDVLQSTNPAAAGIETSLKNSVTTWVGSEINDTWTSPYDNNAYAQPGNPDGFNDSLTLWGLTVYDQGRTPLQLHMVQYDPSATVATVPGAPTSVVAVSGNASLAVTWTAPASTGGSAITDYLVKYSSNSGSTWTNFSHAASTATSCTVTGLTNGTAYVIKVIARNSVGISLPSANSAPVGFGCREPFYLQRDTCSLTVIAIPPVFIHIPMKAPSGPTPIDMRRGCTSEKGADPPPRRYGEWAGAERSRAVAARDASADDWRLATARPARAPCRAATPCCRCCREARFPLIRWISSHSWAAFMSSRLGTVRSSCARRVSDIAERYSPSQAFASRASGVSSSRIFWSTESSRYSSSYDDIAATCSLNRTLIRRTSVGV